MSKTPDVAAAASPRVLVVDDDPTITLLLEHVLQGLGRACDTADDGDEAWIAWQQTRHPLVVLDIGMPRLDGLEVCRLIRAADPERQTFILMLTARDKTSDLEAALDAGADDYITKPVTGQQVLARLRIAQRRMATDSARRAAEQELGRARYLAGIGEMTVTIQHEINNPLTGLLATAELMLMDARQNGQPTDDLQVVIDQAQRIVSLVKRMGEIREPRAVTYSGDRKMLGVTES